MYSLNTILFKFLFEIMAQITFFSYICTMRILTRCKFIAFL
nr:MAG TPA: hypothetical protein [Caudoviricetes sp.]